MFVIRDAQLHALQHAQGLAYVPHLAQRLRRDNPDACCDLDDRQLADALGAVVAMARTHGFTEGLDIMEFFSATRRLPAGFGDAPSVRRLLERVDMPPCKRIYTIQQIPLEIVRDELAALRRPTSGGSRS
jgi:hypothetical protein